MTRTDWQCLIRDFERLRKLVLAYIANTEVTSLGHYLTFAHWIKEDSAKFDERFKDMLEGMGPTNYEYYLKQPEIFSQDKLFEWPGKKAHINRIRSKFPRMANLTDGQVEGLWHAFCEGMFCAGFVEPTPVTLNQFGRWLRNDSLA